MNILVCMPCDTSKLEKLGMPPYKPRAGFEKFKCDSCNQDMWIGPKQLVKRTEENWLAVCAVCVARVDPIGLSNVKTLGG